MANNKQLFIINALVCVVILLQIYILVRGSHSNGGGNITGGNVATNLSINDDPGSADRDKVIEKARMRGYYTASEFAIFEGGDKRTVYRRLESGVITNARKVDGRWRIFCD